MTTRDTEGHAAGLIREWGVARDGAQQPVPTNDVVRRLVALCVTGHLVLSLVWAVLVPPFEAHDETGHFAHVQYVATHLQIPPPGGVLTHWFDEAHQPPLYYWTVGVPGYLLGLGGDMKPDMNPFFLRGDQQGGVNAAVHDPARERWFSHRWTALLLLSRVLSAFYGAVAVWLTFHIARLLLPGDPMAAVLAAAIAACTPTFVYLSGAANNDAAVAATGSGAILACLVWLRSPSADPTTVGGRSLSAPAMTQGTWAAVVAGLCIGLALMTKSSALPLLAAPGLVPLLRLRARSTRLASAVRECVAAFVACALVAGWWYGRNALLYGHAIMDRNLAGSIVEDPAVSLGVLGAAASSNFVAALVQNTFVSYWALFGWGNIAGPRWIYPVCVVLVGVAVGGAALSLADTCWRHITQGPGAERVLALVLMLLLAALPLYRAVRFAAPTLVPGRYLFVCIACITTALAAGIWRVGGVVPRSLAVVLRCFAPLALIVGTIAALALDVLPAYARPQLFTAASPRPRATDIYISYDHKLALTGYVLPRQEVAPGDDLVVRLIWRAEATMSTSYTVSLQIVDADYQVVGRTDRLPGTGNFSTTLWKPGNEFQEAYRVQLDPQKAQSPQLGHLLVVVQEYAASSSGGDDFATRSVLTPLDGQSHETLPAFADLRLGPAAARVPQGQHRYTMGSLAHVINLDVPTGAVRRGQRLTAVLDMQPLQTAARRGVVFAHLLDAQGKVVAQQDAEPHLVGHLYPTTIWVPGERLSITLDVAVPSSVTPGTYALEVGMYWQDDSTRLPVVDAGGMPVPDNRILAKSIRVE